MSDTETAGVDVERLTALRRELHRRPEPAWREFYTTARLVDELETRELDELYVGPEVLADERMAVPDDDELDAWFDRAREAGAREDVLDRLRGGYTGLVAVVRCGETPEDGPTVGLRVDIDGLAITESEADDHAPAGGGFRSENEGYMHACGHDGHAAIGVGVIDAVLASEFEGTLKVFFQPGEELVAGGKAMADSGHLDGVDYLLALHLGLDHPTGEVVAGMTGFLAVSHLRAEFEGASAHAGARPEEGRNAVLAMATAIQNLYAISRHSDGATRVNAGITGGGTATNIIPEESLIEAELRGETTPLMEYMDDRARTVMHSAAEMHDCTVELSQEARAPSATSDPELRTLVGAVAGDVAGVTSVVDHDALGGSEDATFLMQAVQDAGGKAAYVGVGTDHPGGHHTPTFDVDEESLRIAVETLTGSILRIGRQRP